MMVPEPGDAILDGGEKIQKATASIDELISRKLNNFIAIAAVAGFLLIAALGYESIRTQLVVEAEHQDLLDRSASTLRERETSCAYTKHFVAAIQRFETNQAIANSLEPPSSAAFDKARLYAFDSLFIDLGQLGTDACKGTPL